MTMGLIVMMDTISEGVFLFDAFRIFKTIFQLALLIKKIILMGLKMANPMDLMLELAPF
jgi:hypothetical protein